MAATCRVVAGWCLVRPGRSVASVVGGESFVDHRPHIDSSCSRFSPRPRGRHSATACLPSASRVEAFSRNSSVLQLSLTQPVAVQTTVMFVLQYYSISHMHTTAVRSSQKHREASEDSLSNYIPLASAKQIQRAHDQRRRSTGNCINRSTVVRAVQSVQDDRDTPDIGITRAFPGTECRWASLPPDHEVPSAKCQL